MRKLIISHRKDGIVMHNFGAAEISEEKKEEIAGEIGEVE